MPVTEIGFTFLYIDDIPTAQETKLWASTVCYKDTFTCLYVDDVRTSQEILMGLHGLLRGTALLSYT
jgi:hypothetical protein